MRATVPLVLVLGIFAALSAADVIREGLHVGTTRRGADVIANGTALPEWREESAGGTKALDAGEIAVSLHFTLEPHTLFPNDQNYTMSIISSDSDILELQPKEDEGWLTTNTWDEIAHYGIQCKSLGFAEIQMQLRLPAESIVFDNIRLGLNKTCQRCILSMARGRTPGTPDVINAGVAVPGVNFLAPAAEDLTYFSVWLPNIPGGMTAQKFAVHFSTDNSLLNPGAQITPDEAIAKPIEQLGSGTTVGVYYRCVPRSDNINVPVNMSINVGWKDPIVVSWTKQCGPGTKKPGGWGPAAIFFFTVFIITLVLCVAGCGWNYVKNNRTGCDMVPGIDLFRGCWAKIAGEKKYTPQTNYDEENSSSLNRGYQTDL